MRKTNEEFLFEALQKGEVEVTFTKVNGDTRIMRCTLNGNFIPPENWPFSTAEKDGIDENTTLPVFDTDIQEWRSFKVKNIIEWRVI